MAFTIIEINKRSGDVSDVRLSITGGPCLPRNIWWAYTNGVPVDYMDGCCPDHIEDSKQYLIDNDPLDTSGHTTHTTDIENDREQFIFE